MHKRLIILLFMMISLSTFAQEKMTYAEASETTLQYYESKNWEALLIVGKRAELAGLGFYRLYQRMGIAYFETRRYFKSEKYLQLALNENAYDPLARKLLYYSIYHQGDEFRAEEYRLSLPKEEQPEALSASKRKLDYIYVETGLKFSSRLDSVGNIIPFTIGLGHKLGPKTNIYHNLSLVSQDYYWGNYSQLNYYLGPEFGLGNGFTFKPSLGIIGLWGNSSWNSSSSTIETSSSLLGPPPGPMRFDTNRVDQEMDFKGKLSQIGFILNAGLNWKKGRWELQPSIAYSHYSNVQKGRADIVEETEHSWFVSSIDNGTEMIDTSYSSPIVYDTTYWQLQYGLGASVTLPVMKDGLRLGLKAELATSRNRTYALLSPWAEVRLGKSIWLRGNYFWGNSGSFLLESNASVVNNTIDPIQHKAGLMGVIPVGKNVTLYLMYQYEQRKESQYEFNYHFNTAITGIKIRL